MGDGIMGKFICFWIFLIGGLVIAKLLGIADTAGNMAVLSISLAFIYVGWTVLRAKGREKAARGNPRQAPKNPGGHKKKKR